MYEVDITFSYLIGGGCFFKIICCDLKVAQNSFYILILTASSSLHFNDDCVENRNKTNLSGHFRRQFIYNSERVTFHTLVINDVVSSSRTNDALLHKVSFVYT